MFSEPVIELQNLGKRYNIYAKPVDRLKQLFFPKREYAKPFWAVRGVSLTVRRGETIGVVGRNGSGKSTLLQLICQTLYPTEGSVTVKGKVAALLELGAGFNPEFTGRENVFLAASLYGLSNAQIQARFNAIAEFADIGEHIEEPVKTYSSGMYVRLAFSVIAHVDADVLVIDEALAVGDAVFTQKCMRFIREFRARGTLFFVSHDMASVINLCEKVIWLHQGGVRQVGEAKEVAEDYLQYTLQASYGESEKIEAQARAQAAAAGADAPAVRENTAHAKGWTSGKGNIEAVSLTSPAGQPLAVLQGGETLRLSVKARAAVNMAQPLIGFLVKDRLGQDLFGENTIPYRKAAGEGGELQAGERLQVAFDFVLPLLPNGEYAVTVAFADGDQQDNVQHHWMHDALIFSVHSRKPRWGLVGIPIEQVIINTNL